MKSMTWICIGALTFCLAACAGQPAEEPEPASTEESTAITNEDFDSGDAVNVVETTEAEEPETPDDSTAPDHE